MQVRVGDKLNNNFYDQWSLSDLYFKKAMSLFVKKLSHYELHFVFFVGIWGNHFPSSQIIMYKLTDTLTTSQEAD